MNYLAHAYLSFERPAIVVGNLISDFVKGKKKFDYPAAIQQGMELHRSIDQFTDAHPVTKEGAALFKADYGLYSMAFIDIVYDHFLATDQQFFTDKTLLDFSQNTYSILSDFTEFHPQKFARMFPSMVSNNWLFNYRHAWGIGRSFEGLVYRARYMDDAKAAFTVFENNYEQFRRYFGEFFPELAEFARDQLKNMDEQV
ncbi:MAG TPA: ACP phosphodiesterase [Flavitalea sp.]|nr:ACP phosphodiesterase [Flavitalea sp.]